MIDSINLVVKMAVCMANGGGGTVVMGVAEKAPGRSNAILGVPAEIDLNRLKKAVYDKTDPKITPVFEELRVPEGTGRLLVMQIYPGMPPYTDTSGRGTIRIGKDCQPLTGTLRRRIAVETGETDFTAEPLDEKLPSVLSPSAMEMLRTAARAEKAPDDLLHLSDSELMQALGLLRDGRVTKAALLLGGSEEAIRRHISGYTWTFLRMEGDTRYSNREDRSWSIPSSVRRIEEHIMPFNPITTIEYGLFHFEYRTFPEITLRETLMNAFCHADFRIAAPVMVKSYPNRLEISNPGGFIAGITPSNILHHQPAARNPLLVDALVRLRLVNRSNLGISRMFEAFLIEGKEPPRIEELGESVRVTMKASDFTPEFRSFIAEQSRKGHLFTVDELLVLKHLLHSPEIDSAKATALCQRNEVDMREVMSRLESYGLVARGGIGRGTYWTLRPEIHRHLAGPGHPERDRRIDWEAAKTRILSILMERAKRDEPGLSNKEIRQITRFDRFQVIRLMRELIKENPEIKSPGMGRNAQYNYNYKYT